MNNRKKDYGLCPPPIEAQKALDILTKHFLGEDWYVSLSMGREQVNAEAVYDILSNNQGGILKKIFGK
jgi:hypothetical protein